MMRLWLLVLFASLGIACPGQKAVPQAPAQAGPVADRKAMVSGIGFRLRNADPAPDVRPAAPPATKLSDAEIQRLLARLAPLKPEPGDAKSFALRGKSLPPPRPGNTESKPFPPAESSPAPSVSRGPLTVTRKQPAGDVPLAPFLAVSFSEPMVALGGDSASPIRLVPTPEGHWRWIGTQTLVFEPKTRFPMATDYAVEVPAEVKSISGAQLAARESWTFSTPALGLVASFPSMGPTARDPIMWMSFDQEIDAAQLLPFIRVTSGGQAQRIRIATAAEIEGDADVASLAQRAEPGRWIAMRAAAPLPSGSTIDVSLVPGAPSREGPRVTTKKQGFTFRTFDSPKLESARCGGDTCRPMDAFVLQFNNPLDEEAFESRMVTVTPEVPGLRIEVSHQSIIVSGRTKGRTAYEVAVSPEIADRFGQTLGATVRHTFRVGSAEPQLFAEEREMIVVDPARPEISVASINRPDLQVSLYSVRPEQYAAYQKWRWQEDPAKGPEAPPGRLVSSRVVRPTAAPDELTETPIALAPALQDGFGHVIVRVEPVGPMPKEPWRRQRFRSWVQVTRLGLSAHADSAETLAWITDLSTGAPVAGADVWTLGTKPSSKTGADGLVRLSSTPPVNMLFARRDKDLSFLGTGEGSLAPIAAPDALRYWVFDDRQLYKPKEQVRVKGWLRRLGMTKNGDVSLAANATRINWKAEDARQNELAKGTAAVSPTGGFDLTFQIPDAANLGYATVVLSAEGHAETHRHLFQIQEFRRPEFEISVSKDEGPHVVGTFAVVTARAKYFTGAGLPSAPVTWNVSQQRGSFTPPGRSEYHFGAAEPWWPDFGSGAGRAFGSRSDAKPQIWSSVTDGQGAHRLRVDFDPREPAFPMQLRLHADVQDVNRQTWGAEDTLLVHPADRYVGLRTARGFVRAGEPIGVSAIVSDLDGVLASDVPITIRAGKLVWSKQARAWQLDSKVAYCNIRSRAEAASCSVPTQEPGRYRIEATVTDLRGRRSETHLEVWVASDTARPDRMLQGEDARLLWSKTAYAPGEEAEVLVMAPFFPAEGLLTLRRQGIVHVQRFSVTGSSTTLRFPIDESLVPNVEARVDLVGVVPREGADHKPDARLPKRPAFASATANVKVSSQSRTIDVKVTPTSRALAPGERATVDIELKASRGSLSASEVAVIVADEAVLSLGGYKMPNPLDVFYAPRSGLTQDSQLIEHVVVTTLAQQGVAATGLAAPPMAPMPMASAAPLMREAKMAAGGALADASPIAIRKDMNPLAAFIPRVVPDAQGRARITFALPDNLTRYRVMALAVAGDKQFGSGESTITARLPLMVRPSPPRFLNQGDAFELPIVLHNQTDKPLTVDVAARASNGVFGEGQGGRTTVGASNRVEVRLPMRTVRPGTLRLQVAAASSGFADAHEIELPVWAPATAEAFGTYGQVDQGATAQAVVVPRDVAPDFGHLTLSTSSTALSTLTDAVLYLTRYPYECNEQLASRVLAIAALRDVLAAFRAPDMPSPDALLTAVNRDLTVLKTRQLGDGGWGFWYGGQSHPYVSIHVAHALARAAHKGFDVPRDMSERAKGYLKTIERHIPASYGPDVRRVLQAYALYVRHQIGDDDVPRARALVAEAGGASKLPLEAAGWIWPILARHREGAADASAIRKHAENRVTETAGAAHFATSYADEAQVLLHADRRVDAIFLQSLIDVDPKNDLVAKLLAGLLGHRKKGRWDNTQENAFVLLAIDRYFQVYEKAEPNFVARAWLGNELALEQTYRGRSADRADVTIPLAYVTRTAPGGTHVVVAKEGSGRLYYRLGMEYAPARFPVPPIERGFSVSRTYEAASDPGAVRRDPDGTWRVKAGSLVRVRLKLVAPSRRYHVALVDALPAGFETVNGALVGTTPVTDLPSPTRSLWWGPWFEHQNMRDERTEAFTSLLWDGVYDYTYVARATSPGTFVAPPPKAEEMYSPETFGRGASERVIIE